MEANLFQRHIVTVSRSNSDFSIFQTENEVTKLISWILILHYRMLSTFAHFYLYFILLIIRSGKIVRMHK